MSILAVMLMMSASVVFEAEGGAPGKPPPDDGTGGAQPFPVQPFAWPPRSSTVRLSLVFRSQYPTGSEKRDKNELRTYDILRLDWGYE